MPHTDICAPCNSRTPYFSMPWSSGQHAMPAPEELDIWFDAEDSVQIDDTWFDTSDNNRTGKNSPEQNADSLVPFTEDCRRSIQQFMATLGSHEESKIIAFCLSKILPGVPVNLAIAANSLYTAITERRNIDTAALQALGLASWCLADGNILTQSASYIRETVTDWLGETFVHQFLADEENQPSSTVFTALAVTALVAKHWMSDRGAAQRALLRLPASIANLFIRLSHCWNALGLMAGNNVPSNNAPLQISTFGVEAAEITASPDVIPHNSETRVAIFTANSTSNPQSSASATVQTSLAHATSAVTPSMSVFTSNTTKAVDAKNPAQVPGRLKSGQQNKVEVSSPIKMQNDKVIDMLRNKGLLETTAEGETNPVCKEKMLSAAAGYLFNNKEKAADYDTKIKLLASSILAAKSQVSIEKAVPPTLLQANTLIREWVFNNILGDSPAQYIKNKMDNGTFPHDTNINMLDNQLSYIEMIKTRRVNDAKITLRELDRLYVLWDSCLIEEMPFLKFKDQEVSSLKLSDYKFPALYSGARSLQRDSNKPYTYVEAITIGENMWDSAARDGITENNLNDYSVPALFILKANHFNESERHDGNIFMLTSMYVKYRNEVKKLHNDITFKYEDYLYEAQLWSTKEKLADNIISQCSTLRTVPRGITFNNFRVNQLYISAAALAKDNYMTGRSAPCTDAPNNLEDEYQKRTSSVANTFREIDHYLIQSAIHLLPKNDYNFISSKHTELYPANIDMVNYQTRTSSATGLIKYRDLTVPLARTKLIVARRGHNMGVERIYAFKATTNGDKGYQIIRVDRDIEQYIKNGLLDYNFGNAYRINPSRSTVTANGRDLNYSFNIFTSNPITEKTQDNILPLVNWLKNRHRDDLYRGLYTAGHDKTDFPRARNEAKRMIPFYDCVAGSNRNPGQMVPRCLFEGVEFIPDVAQPSNLNRQFGPEITRRVLSSQTTK